MRWAIISAALIIYLGIKELSHTDMSKWTFAMILTCLISAAFMDTADAIVKAKISKAEVETKRRREQS